MNSNAKEKLLQAAIELVESEEKIENITVRDIAKKADVNVALINYYYQSKENLISQVVQIKMGSIISEMMQRPEVHENAVEGLKSLLITTADYSFKHNDIFRISVANELKVGCKNSCELVMPFLSEIFKGKDESEIRIIALQLMLPFHFIVMHPEIYNIQLNTDFFDKQKRAQKISEMVDSIL